MSTPAPKFLQKRGQSWYCRVKVPRTLQAVVGNTHLRQALGTKSLAVAERRKWKVVAQMKAYLDELANSPTKGLPPVPRHHAEYGNPQEMAEQIHQLRQEGDHEQADAIEFLAMDHAQDMEAKYGPQKADRWFRTATRTRSATTKTLDEMLEPWLASTTYTEQTKEGYRRTFRDLRAMLGLEDGEAIVPEDITDDVVLRYVVDYLPSQGYHPSTMSNRIGALSSFWIFLQQRRVVPLQRNPWQGHRISQKAQDGPKSRRRGSTGERERAYTDSELVALLQGTERAKGWEVYPRVRDLLLLGLYTGMRLNEASSLLVRDVSMDGQPTGAGDHAQPVSHAIMAIREGKTDAATRTLAVSHWAVLGMLQRRTEGKQTDGQLFEELTRGGPDGKLSWAVSKSFTRYRRECGVPDGTDYHSLRRTFLTLHEHRGSDYVAVCRFVGHQVPTMMHAVYSAGASREALLRVAEATRYSPAVEASVAQLVAP